MNQYLNLLYKSMFRPHLRIDGKTSFMNGNKTSFMNEITHFYEWILKPHL